MIYGMVKVLMRISVRGFFRKVHFIGKENLDVEGAIFVSNHPSALMDPLVVAVHSKKQLSFIAGAEWFGEGLKDWLFQKQFNMIPVYRPWLAKEGQKVSNEDMFRECYECIDKGARIMIYPEASSETTARVRELKTGAARIKLGADKYMAGKKTTKVIPIGMNYTNPHRFQTSVVVNVGEPIDFGDLPLDPTLDDKTRAEKMTEQIHDGMKACVLHIESEEDELIVKNVIKLLSNVVMKDLGIEKDDQERIFKIKKDIISAVEQFKAQKSEDVRDLEGRLNYYISEFETTGLRNFNPFEQSKASAAGRVLLLLLGLPLFTMAIALNLLPYLVSKAVFNAMFLEKVKGETKQGELHPAFAGSLSFGVGVAIFLLWYVLLAVAVGISFSAWWLGIATVVVGYHTGRYAVPYIRLYFRWRNTRWWNKLERNHPEKINRLMAERQALINELLELRDTFLESKR